jgi:hypothetical protein
MKTARDQRRETCGAGLFCLVARTVGDMTTCTQHSLPHDYLFHAVLLSEWSLIATDDLAIHHDVFVAAVFEGEQHDPTQ